MSRRRVLAAVVGLPAILGSAMLAGCIVIPVDYHATGSRPSVSMTATNVFHAGITTREDILLASGERISCPKMASDSVTSGPR